MTRRPPSRERITVTSTDILVLEWKELQELGVSPKDAAKRVGIGLDTIQKAISREKP